MHDRNRENELEWMVRTVGRMHFERIRSEMAARGLSDVSHPRILFMLLHHPDRLFSSQKELAAYLGVRPATVAVSLRRMEAHGILHKVADEQDLRRNHIVLTEKGRERLEGCAAAFKEIELGMFRGFTPEERETLAGFYRRIRGNLSDMGASAPQAQTQEQGQDRPEGAV
jgi:DNA-binding MarR family transcriptional regulator